MGTIIISKMSSLRPNFILIFLIILVSGIGAEFENEYDCGRGTAQRFIVGGDPVGDHFPFMVSLQFNTSEKQGHFCGGTILNSRWVLTAAHCLMAIPLLELKYSKGKVLLAIGSSSKNESGIGPDIKFYEINKTISHPDFREDDLISNDIALIKTSEELPIREPNIAAICLPPKNALPIDTKITLAGWGVSSETNMLTDKEPPNHLKVVQTEVVSEELCRKHMEFRNLGIVSFRLGSRLCFRMRNSTACRGDSGGPAFQVVNGKYYQFGICSFLSGGVLFMNTCFKDNPVFYQKTSLYIDWIQNQIKNN